MIIEEDLIYLVKKLYQNLRKKKKTIKRKKNNIQDIKIGDYCKHFKGKNLIEKNIYKILFLNVIYSGDNATKKLDDLVVYENIFDGKIFTIEACDIFTELSDDKKEMFNQIYKVQKLTEEEIAQVNTNEFKIKKLEYINNK